MSNAEKLPAPPPPPPYDLPDSKAWPGVTGEAVSEILRRHQITGGECGRMLDMPPDKVRKWIGNVLSVPYTYWYVLLDKINRREAQAKEGSVKP